MLTDCHGGNLQMTFSWLALNTAGVEMNDLR